MIKSHEIGVTDGHGDALRLVIRKDENGTLHVDVINLMCLLEYPPIVGSLDRVEQGLALWIDATPAQTIRKQIEQDVAQGVL